MTQGGGFFLELDGTQFKKELKQLQKLYFQTLREMEAQGATGRKAQQLARESIVQRARSSEGVGLGTSEAGGLGGYGKRRSSGLWVKGTGKTGMPSTGLSMAGVRGSRPAEATSQITRENIGKILSGRVMDHAEHDDSISEHSEKVREKNEKREMASAKARANFDWKHRKLSLKAIEDTQKTYWGRRIKMATVADLSLANEREKIRETERKAEETNQKARQKARDQFYKDNSKANRIVYQQEQKTNRVRENAVNKIRNQIQASQDMIRSERQLGQASGVSASGIQRQILSLEKLRGATALATGDRARYVQGINAEIAALQKLQAQQLNSTSQMVFMEGASAGVQKGIRNIGAAAQGSMLAMSAMNGDVMGLAFSLIFLQFAANLPVALGFGAIALAGALAFKQLKKINEENKRVKLVSNAFFVATQSAGAYALALQKAEGMTKDLGLSEDDQSEASKVLVQAQAQLRTKGIEPTNDALRVALNAFLLAKVQGKEYEAALQSSINTMNSFAETGIATFEGTSFTIEALNQRGGAALDRLTDAFDAETVVFKDFVQAAKEAGHDIPAEIQAIADSAEGSGTLENLLNLPEFQNIVGEWAGGLLDMGFGAKMSQDKIDASFSDITDSAEINLGKDGRVSLAAEEFNKSMGGMATTAVDAAEKAQDAINKLTSLGEMINIPAKDLESAQLKSSKMLAHLDTITMLGGGGLLYSGTDSSPHTAGSQINLAADDLAYGTSTIININVTGNTVSSDEGLANEIEMAITRGVNWSAIPTPGIK